MKNEANGKTINYLANICDCIKNEFERLNTSVTQDRMFYYKLLSKIENKLGANKFEFQDYKKDKHNAICSLEHLIESGVCCTAYEKSMPQIDKEIFASCAYKSKFRKSSPFSQAEILFCDNDLVASYVSIGGIQCLLITSIEYDCQTILFKKKTFCAFEANLIDYFVKNTHFDAKGKYIVCVVDGENDGSFLCERCGVIFKTIGVKCLTKIGRYIEQMEYIRDNLAPDLADYLKNYDMYKNGKTDNLNRQNNYNFALAESKILNEFLKYLKCFENR